ncbi:cytochrome P450 [Lophiostoma macrostomum CBS 122681]|uniref:Cytochrome P450 n=1 Tax=Lophiostoma macrostomum CBS 122681 TaxID=1314788 RepID=A0A6A6TCZ9_9PLEO|nr:cytochrome P450 [Lophiostoma macrostomum CBS 122681]
MLAYIHTLQSEYFYILPTIATLTYVLYQRFFSPLSKIPGPFLASLTSWWLVFAIRRHDINRRMQRLHQKYGPIVRITPDEISVADLSAIRKIYSSHGSWAKSNYYSVFQGTRKHDIFAGRDVKVHAQQRKMVARAYAMETLKELEVYVDKMLNVFKRKMDENAGQSVDMARWMQLFAFDTIGEITWSTNFGFMEASKDDGTFSTIRAVGSSGSWLGVVPWLYKTHQFLQPVIGNWLGINGRHGGLRDFAIRETAARKNRPVEKPDIVGRMLDTSKKNPEEFTYTDVISMATSNVAAGSDTTAISLRSIIYHLLQNPETKRKLIEEIAEFRRKGQLSNSPRYTEAQKMPYLQAAIYEGMRVHPAVGVNLPRVVPPGGAHLAGHYIPSGTVAGVNAWVVHQNEEVYGADAKEFRPDRWLEEGSGDMHRFFFSFGAGSRACIGRNISLLEMSKLIPTIFLNYEVELANPTEEWKEDCSFFVQQSNFYVRMTPRSDTAVDS